MLSEFDLADITGQAMRIENPFTADKLMVLGEALGLREGSRVIDFGCGYGTALILWAQRFGIEGVGIDLREQACARARESVAAAGLSAQVTIAYADGRTYLLDQPAGVATFDVAVCLGAAFIWGGFGLTVRALRDAVGAEGRIAIGEEHWLSSAVPAGVAAHEPDIHQENDLLATLRAEGMELRQILRSSHADWDAYEGARWQGLLRWLDTHKSHPERGRVQSRLHRMQEDYLGWGREYLGWAVYTMG